jgi:hypothetical protein
MGSIIIIRFWNSTAENGANSSGPSSSGAPCVCAISEMSAIVSASAAHASRQRRAMAPRPNTLDISGIPRC